MIYDMELHKMQLKIGVEYLRRQCRSVTDHFPFFLHMILGFPSIFVFESHLYVITLPSIVGPFEYVARGTVGGCPQCAEINEISYVNS